MRTAVPCLLQRTWRRKSELTFVTQSPPPRDAAVLFAEAAKTEAVKEERNENEQGPYLRASRDQDHQPPDPPPHDDKPGCSKTVEQVSLTKPPLRKGVHSFFQCLCVI